jgi:hypothetical protein
MNHVRPPPVLNQKLDPVASSLSVLARPASSISVHRSKSDGDAGRMMFLFVERGIEAQGFEFASRHIW